MRGRAEEFRSRYEERVEKLSKRMADNDKWSDEPTQHQKKPKRAIDVDFEKKFGSRQD
jgi:hypothetical protein